MKNFFMRVYQKIMAVAVYFLPWREPTVYKGVGMIRMLPAVMRQANIKRVLIVTDQGIRASGILHKVLAELNVTYVVFDHVEPNPDEETVKKIRRQYVSFGAEGLIGLGGGSVIDATKVVAALVNQPQKEAEDLKGLLKVRGRTAYTVMIPTTAGTGSEVTLAAVISSKRKRKKYTIMDTKLIPDAAILAPELLASLPKRLTAETGMDALTHAVESFISGTRTKQTKKDGVRAVKLIHEYLNRSYDIPDDLKARFGMLEASYYAGRAFTRAYVGNIHAMSHALTAFYGSPHGRTNALILPIVLRIYGESVHPELAELADAIDLTDVSASNEEKALAFTRWVEGMNDRFEIPRSVPEISDQDLDALISHAYKEANPMYPVPVIFSKEDFREAFLKVKG